LKSQAKGCSAIATMKAKYNAIIATSLFTLKGKVSFDQYVGKHQRAYNKLLYLEEPVAETKKVTEDSYRYLKPKVGNYNSELHGRQAEAHKF
jgi:hypothetical protein